MLIRYTSLIALGATYGVMVLGSYVSATGLGLSCPDWPLCRGNILPTEEIIIEWTHRFFGLLVAIFTVTTSVLALRMNDKKLKMITSLAVMFVFIQITLGAIVIGTRLQPEIVAIHLAVALAVFTTVLLSMLRVRNYAKSIEV